MTIPSVQPLVRGESLTWYVKELRPHQLISIMRRAMYQLLAVLTINTTFPFSLAYTRNQLVKDFGMRDSEERRTKSYTLSLPGNRAERS